MVGPIKNKNKKIKLRKGTISERQNLIQTNLKNTKQTEELWAGIFNGPTCMFSFSEIS